MARKPRFPRKVDRHVYPGPEYRFSKAKIGLTYQDSKPDFPRQPNAPERAPNVLLVLLDDVGYGWSSAFGGRVSMPTAERLARSGLKYCQFHTTALCSPTRAALLTGRNHHSAASGVIGEIGTGYPGYTGIIPKSCGTIAETLQQNGYGTAWWGKNHNVPDNQTSAAGPFDNWPTQRGFDYFYGFIGGETDQFRPALYRGTEPVEAGRTPEEGYQLTRDLADDCIGWMRQQKSIAPQRPLFLYFAPGAGHAPHQPPLDWRGRHQGKFDQGWDAYREEVFKRQIELGVVPPDAKLTARPAEIPAWDSFDDEQKQLFSRMAENYADFLSHADHEVGRVVQALDDLGELENTLVLYIIGDNGSSAEGTLTGTLNEMLTLGGYAPDLQQLLDRQDEIGLPGTSPHYPVGWAWAGDTPFQWTKQVASHFGGTRNPMIVSWPREITEGGGSRFQFHHIIDIAPTLLEVIGITEPTMMKGTPQKPIEGVSLAYTFDEKAEDAPSTRTTQYFEMFGNRALYRDGWMASCRHGRLPWQTVGTADFAKDRWELYDLRGDYSQAVDVAARHPEKLRELQDLFMVEAAKYDVLPLDDRFIERADVTLRPSWFYGRKRVTFYSGMTYLPEGSAPKTNNISYTLTVGADLPSEGTEGVLVCVGGDMGGWSLYVKDRRLVYHYNFFDVERHEAVSDIEVPTGRVELKLAFTNESDTLGGPASARIFINGKDVGHVAIPRQCRGRFSTECMDVGMDSRSPVSRGYLDRGTFPFTGRIEYATFDFDLEVANRELTAEERLEQHVRLD
ncbi:arylsulfatase [Myxococcus sp. CA051A]|uniref:arylsulfatase n=1 Tax=unclassified Myxococcus TaxID=2648731 RepID=UPI00157B7191|nr:MULTISPECIES: arylsulfatase [unclassified Myxococcus]NTX14718.1 arylsulfatase [Myxococcus sp. CA056]NTX40373.1 arylsulfatase [Myxococcus sp. CA033]NTX67071.1 arylsulfatase [Myxococcus sp. CA051A]